MRTEKRSCLCCVSQTLLPFTFNQTLCFFSRCTEQTNAGLAPDDNFQCRQKAFNRGFLNSTPLPDSRIIPVSDVLSVIVEEMPYNNSLCMLYLDKNLKAAHSMYQANLMYQANHCLINHPSLRHKERHERICLILKSLRCWQNLICITCFFLL